MLKWLHIKNLALVNEADIELGPGFNAITGETGAGKSVLMGAVTLLLGGRFDKSSIRQETDRCEVAGEFSLEGNSIAEIARLLEENGLEPCGDDNQLLLRRVFTHANGRIFINSSPATAQLLRAIGDLLIDVHSADEAHGLMKVSTQLKALDRFAKLDSLLEQCASAWGTIRSASAQKQRFLDSMPSADEAEGLRKDISEIEKQNPIEGEDSRLEATHSAAANSKIILEIASAAAAALNESDDSLIDRLSTVRRLLRPLENVDSEYAEKFLSQCDAISNALSELTNAIQSHAASVELDENEFAALEERMQILQTLKRKYGPGLADVLNHLEDSRGRLDLFENSARERERLEAAESAAVATHLSLCKELSAERKRAAEKLSANLKKEIIKLGFKKADFLVEFFESQPGVSGMDRIEFMFSANPGVPVKPLRDVASSGELSRVMLAIKTVLAEVDNIGTIIFDEIDANIGGETAVVVAGELNELGRRKQILCISHLPQVAARADHHFVVEKLTTSEHAVSKVRVLDRSGRIIELGRMLGGGQAAERHAETLL